MTSHQMMEAIEDRDQIPRSIVSRLDSGLVTSRDVDPRLVLADSWLSFGKSIDFDCTDRFNQLVRGKLSWNVVNGGFLSLRLRKASFSFVFNEKLV